VSDKDASSINEQPQLLIRDLERDESMFRMRDVEIAICSSQTSKVQDIKTDHQLSRYDLGGIKKRSINARWIPEKSVK
jgi:hypothetical protein